MACELLSDQYPFDRSSATRFLADVLAPQNLHKIQEQWNVIKIVCTKLKPSSGMPAAAQPDEHRNAVLERVSPGALREVIRRLLARRPEKRFASAEAVLEALEVATGESFGAATESTRESFLQAARLIGRERELAQLAQALEAARKGQGSAWLVEGESGIGKSRLLDELRTLALVRGAQVVRGQAVSGGGTAYCEWGQALRPLCLRMQPNSLEASVLKTLVPDLPELLQDAVADCLLKKGWHALSSAGCLAPGIRPALPTATARLRSFKKRTPPGTKGAPKTCPSNSLSVEEATEGRGGDQPLRSRSCRSY